MNGSLVGLHAIAVVHQTEYLLGHNSSLVVALACVVKVPHTAMCLALYVVPEVICWVTTVREGARCWCRVELVLDEN